MTEPKLLLSPLAELDLIEIGAYIARDNPARARKFVGEIRDFLSLLALNPHIGRLRPELKRGLRSIPFVGYPYSIYYRIMPKRSGIKVERVLHGARDVSRIV